MYGVIIICWYNAEYLQLPPKSCERLELGGSRVQVHGVNEDIPLLSNQKPTKGDVVENEHTQNGIRTTPHKRTGRISKETVGGYKGRHKEGYQSSCYTKIGEYNVQS